MWRVLSGTVGRLLGRGPPKPARSYDEVMAAVHKDLLGHAQRAPGSVTDDVELDLSAQFKSKTRQELRGMADAALHGHGEERFPQLSTFASCCTSLRICTQACHKATNEQQHCTLRLP